MHLTVNSECPCDTIRAVKVEIWFGVRTFSRHVRWGPGWIRKLLWKRKKSPRKNNLFSLFSSCKNMFLRSKHVPQCLFVAQLAPNSAADYADCKFHAVAIAVNYKNGSTTDNSIVDRNCIDILIGCSIITLHYWFVVTYMIIHHIVTWPVDLQTRLCFLFCV